MRSVAPEFHVARGHGSEVESSGLRIRFVGHQNVICVSCLTLRGCDRYFGSVPVADKFPSVFSFYLINGACIPWSNPPSCTIQHLGSRSEPCDCFL